MADVIEREWTAIGTEGFEYYWDPEQELDDKGRHKVLFRHASDHEMKAVGRIEAREVDLGYALERLRMDLEWSWRRRMP